MKKAFVLLFAFVCVSCIATAPPVQKDPSKVTGRPPEISDSFTYSRIPSPWILPIFIDAKDGDGDLVGFWVTVSQLGGNMFSRHYVPIKEGKASHVLGFMTLDVPYLRGVEYLRVEVTAVDSEGNRSNTVIHSVEINMVTSLGEGLPSKWKDANHRRIGHIFFDFERNDEGQGDNLFMKL